MLNLVSLALALVKLGSALLDWQVKRGHVAEGEARQALRQLEVSHEQIRKATSARAAAEHGKLQDNLPYRD